jgi:hypothetical protein
MRITESVEKITFVDELKEIQCNCCGKTFEPNNNEFHSMQQINLSFGYESQFDNQKWDIDLCEVCLLKIIKGFKHVPDKFMSDPYHISSFDSDSVLHQQLFDEWKVNQEWNYEDENPYEEYYQDEQTNENHNIHILKLVNKQEN